jgi:hypothetical protein
MPTHGVSHSLHKSDVFAYLLWITTGLFGTHHFYLGHDEKAFLWLVTFGALPLRCPARSLRPDRNTRPAARAVVLSGGCGMAWLRDSWRISHHVKWINLPEHERKEKIAKALKPPVYTCRYDPMSGSCKLLRHSIVALAVCSASSSSGCGFISSRAVHASASRKARAAAHATCRMSHHVCRVLCIGGARKTSSLLCSRASWSSRCPAPLASTSLDPEGNTRQPLHT